jgi:hypothetical protein
MILQYIITIDLKDPQGFNPQTLCNASMRDCVDLIKNELPQGTEASYSFIYTDPPEIIGGHIKPTS